MHHIIVPDAKDAIAAALDLGCAGGICLPLLRVRAAVDCDCELLSGRREINDIRTDRMLTAKSGARSAARARRATSSVQLPSRPAAAAALFASVFSAASNTPHPAVTVGACSFASTVSASRTQ
jgi:hypothetical protein